MLPCGGKELRRLSPRRAGCEAAVMTGPTIIPLNVSARPRPIPDATATFGNDIGYGTSYSTSVDSNQPWPPRLNRAILQETLPFLPRDEIPGHFRSPHALMS